MFQLLLSIQKAQAVKANNLAEKAALNNLSKLTAAPFHTTVGNANGKITIVEFMDYSCGYCKAVAPSLERIAEKNSNVRIIVRYLPLFGETSSYAAKMAYFAGQQVYILISLCDAKVK